MVFFELDGCGGAELGGKLSSWKAVNQDMSVELRDGSKRDVKFLSVRGFRCKDTGQKYRVGPVTMIGSKHCKEETE